MSVYGPDAKRIQGQMRAIANFAGATAIWRQYISASTGTGSAYFAGGGETFYYREQLITALMRPASQMETPLPAGMVMAGDLLCSTFQKLGTQDEILWNKAIWRIEGDTLPVQLGGRVWYRTILRRGDVTG